MVTESSRLESLSKLCQTTEDIPKVLEHISGVVAGAMSLDWEVESNILVTHLGGMQDNRLSVNFSSIQAYSKFTVTFHINPVVYPEERIFCECQHDIGDITTEKVLDALAQVPPGSNYLVNMVTIVDQMLYNHGTRRPS
ncbi:PREDICTED: uncharacterized protein LOC106804779 [Priapulus caudatus]|uniref:Uncharacterized protein LOC106804779 n=1 Tax=Priapulus caudatus TaxID=37621 RepID=A0ABM1DNS8_PRICU|nr:PREDICTED: uncharacterized protein LOC106804779 [Priapulus caudatus]